jgi:hypothetical protein
MSIRTILAGVAAAALALMPSVALAYLEVDANGFHRIVVGSLQNGPCNLARVTGGRMVRCPDGSRGTLTFYRHTLGMPVCQLDFWYQAGAAKRWHISLSHQSADNGGCTTQWQGPQTLNVNPASP